MDHNVWQQILQSPKTRCFPGKISSPGDTPHDVNRHDGTNTIHLVRIYITCSFKKIKKITINKLKKKDLIVQTCPVK